MALSDLYYLVQAMYRFILIIGLLITFIGFCIVLIDWIQDYATGFYRNHPLEALLETTGLVAYIVFALRFINSRLSLFK